MMEHRGSIQLAELPYDAIQAHILDPDANPLPEKLEGQFKRVLQIARLMDSYPEDMQIIRMMHAKDRTSIGQIRKDISLARELFKSRQSFDWDFWFAWQIKDQIELIREAKNKGDLKAWNAAKKVLHEIIGEKPVAVEDPRRMERNNFYVQVNYGGKVASLDFSALRNLDKDTLQKLMAGLYEPASEEEAEEIFNS